MADPFAFLLREQEGAQEKQLENDQYKENAVRSSRMLLQNKLFFIKSPGAHTPGLETIG